jgi:hypothetical protein
MQISRHIPRRTSAAPRERRTDTSAANATSAAPREPGTYTSAATVFSSSVLTTSVTSFTALSKSLRQTMPAALWICRVGTPSTIVGTPAAVR